VVVEEVVVDASGEREALEEVAALAVVEEEEQEEEQVAEDHPMATRLPSRPAPRPPRAANLPSVPRAIRVVVAMEQVAVVTSRNNARVAAQQLRPN
jgi:hypothetical protein